AGPTLAVTVALSIVTVTVTSVSRRRVSGTATPGTIIALGTRSPRSSPSTEDGVPGKTSPARRPNHHGCAFGTWDTSRNSRAALSGGTTTGFIGDDHAPDAATSVSVTGTAP